MRSRPSRVVLASVVPSAGKRVPSGLARACSASVLATLCCSAIAGASQDPTAASEALVRAHTEQLATRAAAGETPDTLEALIQARRTALRSLALADPEAALRQARAAAAHPLLQSLKSQLEPEIQFEGQVAVIIADDFERGVSRRIYKLTDPDGRSLQLVFAGEAPFMAPHSALRVNGWQIDGLLLVERHETL